MAVAWWVWVERGNSARFFVFERNGSIQSFVDGFGFLGHVGFKTKGLVLALIIVVVVIAF